MNGNAVYLIMTFGCEPRARDLVDACCRVSDDGAGVAFNLVETLSRNDAARTVALVNGTDESAVASWDEARQQGYVHASRTLFVVDRRAARAQAIANVAQDRLIERARLGGTRLLAALRTMLAEAEGASAEEQVPSAPPARVTQPQGPRVPSRVEPTQPVRQHTQQPSRPASNGAVHGVRPEPQPRAPAPARPTDPARQTPRRPRAGFDPARRVLLFNADSGLREEIRDAAYSAAIAPDFADSAEQALSLFRGCRHPAVLIDSELSGADPFRLCRTIKQEAPETAVILIAGRKGWLDSNWAGVIGCQGTLERPIDRRRFARMLDEVFSGATAREVLKPIGGAP